MYVYIYISLSLFFWTPNPAKITNRTCGCHNHPISASKSNWFPGSKIDRPAPASGVRRSTAGWAPGTSRSTESSAVAKWMSTCGCFCGPWGLCPKPIPLVLMILTCCNPHGMSQTWGTPRIKWYINCNFLHWPNSKRWYPHVSQLQYGSPVSKNRLAPSVDNYVYHFFGANPLSETVPSSMVMVLVQYQLP